MCFVAGFKLLNQDHSTEVMDFVEQLWLQGQIRGKHSCGCSLRLEAHGNELITIKHVQSVAAFLETEKWAAVRELQPTEMLLHTRYSTSGDWLHNRNNQPLMNKRLALVHNGLISQASPEEVSELYGTRLRTANDSEVLLNHVVSRLDSSGTLPLAVMQALEAIHVVDPPIFACGFLAHDGEMCVVRDHIRPLCLWRIDEWGVVGFASTADIVQRAAKKCKLKNVWWMEAEPHTIYTLGKSLTRDAHYTGQDYPKTERFVRPSLIDSSRVNNKTYTQKGTDLALTSPLDKSGDHRRNLRESFIRYSAAAIASWEIDPNYPLLNYLFNRFSLSKSQEYWLCWLYGVFYHPGSVWYVFNEFPEFEKVDLGRLESWHAAHWRELRYNTDRKYEKGHFVEMFVSYRDKIGAQTPTAQEEFFNKLLLHKNECKNFHAVWKELIQLLRFGRYATYIYTEALARCMGMPIAADTMFLKEAASSRAGLCYAIGKPEWTKAKLTQEQWQELDRESLRLMAELQDRFPELNVDPWFMESCFCAFKGLFRSNKGRYLGYYYDRQADEILQMQNLELCQGVDWSPLWDFRRESVPWEYLGEYATPARLAIQKEWEHVYKNTGHLIGLWPMVKRQVIPNTRIK